MTLTARETTSPTKWALKRIAVEVLALLVSLLIAFFGAVFAGAALVAPILFLLVLAFSDWISRAWFYDAIISPKCIQADQGGPTHDDPLESF